MHPYLTRLGVRPEVREFFSAYYDSDKHGNLVFSYGGEAETYGFAFHRVPATDGLWVARESDLLMVRQVFICGSAMDAIAYLHYHYAAYKGWGHSVFLATGALLTEDHIHWINYHLPGRKYVLLFGNDSLGKLQDLKIAAGIRKVPINVYEQQGSCIIHFRHQQYRLPTEIFSLNAFEKVSGYRFDIRALKPRGFATWFDQLKANAFK